MRCDTCHGAGRIRSGFLCPICDGAGELDLRSPDVTAADTASIEVSPITFVKLATATRSTRRAAVPSRDLAQPATASRRQP